MRLSEEVVIGYRALGYVITLVVISRCRPARDPQRVSDVDVRKPG